MSSSNYHSSSSSSSFSNSQRSSFGGRSRSESSNSSCSASSSGSNSNNVKGKSSSSRLSNSPFSKQQAAILAAANAASKRPLRASTSASKLGSMAATNSTTFAAPTPRNMLHEDEYQDEVIDHMHTMEGQTMASTDLMDVQPELRWFMRPYLVDFLVEIHQTFGLRPETLYLTLNIVDRYVSKRIVYKRHFQLVGCAALLIAAKFEDPKDRVPTVHELSQMCCNAYDESAFTQMEGHVLSTIDWALGFPTPEAWLRISCMQAGEAVKTQSIARFLMESTLFHRDFISVKPSALADGALMLARFINGKATQQTEASAEAVNAAQMIDALIGGNLQSLSLILVKKYATPVYGGASEIVRDFYLSASAAKEPTSPSGSSAQGLLPAQSVSLTGSAIRAANNNDEDEEMSIGSRPATPSSMASTPSRASASDGDYDLSRDEEDDDDMPVTPLSLYALHDPLAAVVAGNQTASIPSSSSTGSVAGKENNKSMVGGNNMVGGQRRSVKMMNSSNSNSSLHQANTKISQPDFGNANTVNVVGSGARAVLNSSSQWENRSQV